MFVTFIIRIIGRSKKHSFRSIMGFALIVAMIVAISGVISGFSTQIFGITEKVGESTSIFIQGKDPTYCIPSPLLDLINHTNIKQVLPISEKMISLSSENESFNCSVVGVNITEFMNYYSRAEVVAGRLPRVNASFPECLIGKDLSTIIGSSEINFTDSSIETEQQLIIVGLIQNVKEFQSAILVDIIDYSKIFNQSLTQNSYQRIKIRMKNGRFMEETISSLKTLLKDYLHYLIIKPEQQADVFTSGLFSDIIRQLNIFFSVLLIIALIRVFHAISWFILNYERDLLIMRSIGMSSSQLISLVMISAALIGNTGLVVGILFGILIPSLIFTILALFFSGDFLIPNFAMTTILSLSILSNLVIVVASLYPAVNISLKKPSTLSLTTDSRNR